MNLKSTSRLTEKDINKLQKAYAKGKIYIEGLIREQEAMVESSEKQIRKINRELDKSSKQLNKYVEGKPIDEEFRDLKERYSALLESRFNLQNAISIAAESITAAKLTMIEGE